MLAGLLDGLPSGLTIEVADVGDAFEAAVLYDGRVVGIVRGLKSDDGESIDPEGSTLEAAYRGRGIGVELYAALYRRACASGFTKVRGYGHTHAAGRVHESLARRYGYSYVYDQESGVDRGPYEYAMCTPALLAES